MRKTDRTSKKLLVLALVAGISMPATTGCAQASAILGLVGQALPLLGGLVGGRSASTSTGAAAGATGTTRSTYGGNPSDPAFGRRDSTADRVYVGRVVPPSEGVPRRDIGGVFTQNPGN